MVVSDYFLAGCSRLPGSLLVTAELQQVTALDQEKASHIKLHNTMTCRFHTAIIVHIK